MRYLVLFLVFFVSACADEEKKYTPEQFKAAGAEIMYNNAHDYLTDESYKKASEAFLAIENEFPYSEWAIRGQVMAAYSHYKNENYDEAIIVLERFLTMHPGNKDADYAQYLMGLCYYDRITDISRDQGITKDAETEFKKLIARYPNSDYAMDAVKKLNLVRDHLAGKDMEVGRYYQSRKQYVGAINRFKTVIKKYDTTSHTPEALHRLVEIYMAMGIKAEAKNYAAVLGHNYPDNEWYQRSFDLLND